MSLKVVSFNNGARSVSFEFDGGCDVGRVGDILYKFLDVGVDEIGSAVQAWGGSLRGGATVRAADRCCSRGVGEVCSGSVGSGRVSRVGLRSGGVDGSFGGVGDALVGSEEYSFGSRGGGGLVVGSSFGGETQLASCGGVVSERVGACVVGGAEVGVEESAVRGELATEVVSDRGVAGCLPVEVVSRSARKHRSRRARGLEKKTKKVTSRGGGSSEVGGSFGVAPQVVVGGSSGCGSKFVVPEWRATASPVGSFTSVTHKDVTSVDEQKAFARQWYERKTVENALAIREAELKLKMYDDNASSGFDEKKVTAWRMGIEHRIRTLSGKSSSRSDAAASSSASGSINPPSSVTSVSERERVLEKRCEELSAFKARVESGQFGLMSGKIKFLEAKLKDAEEELEATRQVCIDEQKARARDIEHWRSV